MPGSKILETSSSSSFLSGVTARFSSDPVARKAQEQFHEWAGEILEWSVFYCPDLWDGGQGKCPPIRSYHAEYLENMRKCVLREGYSDDEVAFWMEVVSRDYIKTTLMRQVMLWTITEVVQSGRYVPKGNTEEDLIYITGTEPKARRKMTWIWSQLRANKGIIKDYGYLLPKRAEPNTSSGVEAQLKNGMWVAAYGIKGGMRSAHPRFLFVDDPEELVEGDEKKVAESTWDIWSRTIQGMMGPKTSTCYTANYVGVRCLTKKLTKIHPKRYKERPSEKEVTVGSEHRRVSLWPARFSIEWLANKRREIGDKAYNCEWLLKPTADTGSPILEEWIQFWDSEDLDKFPYYWWSRCPIVIAFDPAYTDEKDSDYTAIVAMVMDIRDLDQMPSYKCIHASRGQWTDHEEILKQVRNVYWDLRRAIGYQLNVYVENAIQSEAKAFRTTNRLMNEKLDNSMPLRDWEVRKDGKTKKSRMSKTAHFYREHRVFFDIKDPNQQDLIDEVVLFGQEDNDDYADAATICLNVFRTIEHRWLNKIESRRRRRDEVFRDPNTGVLKRKRVA